MEGGESYALIVKTKAVMDETKLLEFVILPISINKH